MKNVKTDIQLFVGDLLTCIIESDTDRAHSPLLLEVLG